MLNDSLAAARPFKNNVRFLSRDYNFSTVCKYKTINTWHVMITNSNQKRRLRIFKQLLVGARFNMDTSPQFVVLWDGVNGFLHTCKMVFAISSWLWEAMDALVKQINR